MVSLINYSTIARFANYCHSSLFVDKLSCIHKTTITVQRKSLGTNFNQKKQFILQTLPNSKLQLILIMLCLICRHKVVHTPNVYNLYYVNIPGGVVYKNVNNPRTTVLFQNLVYEVHCYQLFFSSVLKLSTYDIIYNSLLANHPQLKWHTMQQKQKTCVASNQHVQNAYLPRNIRY